MLKVGDKAPDIRIGDFDLASLKGRRVVLYFYPKADTPGCTIESCEFRDHVKEFSKKNAVIIGVSPDKSVPQDKFKQKYDLPFQMVPDDEKKLAQAFGVWKEKNMYGRTVMGIERSTFVIDPEGKIEKIYAKVKAAGHAEQVLGDL
jgi:peroxiredoxin Q/BCP